LVIPIDVEANVMTAASRPLEGLLVVTLEQAVAAPMASRRLADAGARVLKLERPEGDFARGYDKAVHGECTHFVWLNRGKESVTVDLSKADDKRLFEALLSKADVFIQNLKPGSLTRLGYAADALRKRHPRLIQCSISGYGDEGPYAERKAYDLLIQAESGLAAVTGEPERPGRIGVSIVDVGTGMHAYEAILEAVIRRGRTGEGADIRVSMFDCMAEFMAVPLLHGKYATAPKRVGLSHPGIAPYGVFTAKDGVPILIAIQNDREWVALCRDVLGAAERGADPRFATNVARVANRAETDALVQRYFSSATATQACTRLDAADIAYGRVSTVEDVLAHPHYRAQTIATPTGPAEMPAVPVRRAGEPQWPLGGVPASGAHTAAVRREFLGS
jgi:formyl-CoA transferase